MTFYAVLGGSLLTIATMPQIIKVAQTKSSKDVSLIFVWMLLIGRIAWLIHGYRVHDTALMFWNMVGVCLTSVLLFLVYKFQTPTLEIPSNAASQMLEIR